MKHLLLLLFIIFLLMFSNKAIAQESWIKSGLDNLYISKMITTPYGVIAAEFDSRLWLDPAPFNGVRLSKDIGNSWNYSGLENRGITDVAFDNGILYASAYYSGTGYIKGMYYSTDRGNTWNYGGFGKAAHKIYAHDSTVYLAGVGRGLWITKDLGETWELKVGEQNADYEITALAGKNDITITSTTQHTYISNNSGESWEIIPDLEKNTIIDISFGESSIIALGRENRIFRSLDNGKSWHKIQENLNLQPEKILYFESSYYLGQKKLTDGTHDVYTSSDLGSTWQQTNLNKTNSIAAIAGVSAAPSLILSYVTTDTLYKRAVENTQGLYPFLQTPWETSNENELTARIYSYFDHKYPLLGYSYYKEAEENSETTLNYLGTEQQIPEMYYSSHDGYDFSLPYGKEVLAAYEGLAEYVYCKPCGNTITINHPNGYQTTYMHLQNEGLVTANTKWVNTGDIIGKIGMTGNTTGPHLHFAVTKAGAYPDSRTDPFGWQSRSIMDPWNNYSWSDLLGVHTGSKSLYLWTAVEGVSTGYLHNQNVTLTLDNKKVTTPAESTDRPVTVELKTGKVPFIPEAQKKLSYIWYTSVFLDAWDNMGNSIEALLDNATIEIDLPETLAENIMKESLKIYFWDESNSIWEPLATIFDELANKLIAETMHFSTFAVFGERVDSYTPETSILIQSGKDNGWYTEYPTVALTTQNPKDIIYYSTEGEYWNTYTNPFVVEQEGIVTLSYRSFSENGCLENTKYEILKINSNRNYVDTATIKGATFTTL